MTAAQLQLITAAVDGELSATETRAFRALLASSPDAQRLFAKLKGDRDRLQTLPTVAPPADLQARILAKLAAAPVPAPKVKPKPVVEPARSPARAPARRSAWVPVAVAAGVLLCITLGSFAFFHNAGPKHQLAKNSWSNVLPAPQDPSQTVPSPVAGPFERPDPVAVVRVDVSPVPPIPIPHEVPPTAVVMTAPAPRTVSPDLIGFPLLSKLPPFERIEVKVPFLRSVADLGREDVGDELLDAVGRDAGVTPMRFDLFVRDTARGVDMFQNTAKASGVSVYADAATLDKLKKKQIHSVAIYTEVLNAKELAALFAKLAAEDAKFSPRVGDSLHATAVVRSDELELKAALGHDVGLYKRPTGHGPNAGTGAERVAPSKPITADTIDRVVQSVSGSPSSAGSPGSAAAKGPEKPAVLVPWFTHPNAPRLSPTPAQVGDLKQHLRKGGDRKSNAVPVVIVIRSVG